MRNSSMMWFSRSPRPRRRSSMREFSPLLIVCFPLKIGEFAFSLRQVETVALGMVRGNA
jgi:hypothetical protein